MLLILASFLLPFLSDSTSRNDYRGGGDVDAMGQIKFIFANPVKYAQILFKFLSHYVSFENMSIYSTAYAYMGFSLSIYGTLAIVILMFCVFSDKSENDDFPRVLTYKTVSWISFVGQLALVATSLYVSFTPVGHPDIAGCQYRYIIPTLFSSCYALGSVRINNRMNKTVLNTVIFSALIFNSIVTYYQLLSRMFF